MPVFASIRAVSPLRICHAMSQCCKDKAALKKFKEDLQLDEQVGALCFAKGEVFPGGLSGRIETRPHREPLSRDFQVELGLQFLSQGKLNRILSQKAQLMSVHVAVEASI